MSTYNAQKAFGTLQQLSGSIDAGNVIAIIDEVLAVPAPDGIPSVISEVGNAYTQAFATLLNAATDLDDVQNQLPAAWSGEAAETANQEISRLMQVTSSLAGVLSSAGGTLQQYADLLQQAQRGDASARDTLKQAYYQITQNRGPLGNSPAPVGQVRDGVNAMANGADNAADGVGITLQELRGDVNLHAINPNDVASGAPLTQFQGG